MRHIFCGAQRLVLREMKQHFRRSLCILGQQKINLHTINDTRVEACLNFVRRCNQAGIAYRGAFSQTPVDVTKNGFRQKRPIHVGRTPTHRITGISVLADRVIEEASGSIDMDLASAGTDVYLVHYSIHAAVVVDVAGILLPARPAITCQPNAESQRAAYYQPNVRSNEVTPDVILQVQCLDQDQNRGDTNDIRSRTH